MPSHQGFSVSHDSEYANFKILEAAVLASEARKKEEQRLERQKLGLPEIEEERGFFKKMFKSKRTNSDVSDSESRWRVVADELEKTPLLIQQRQVGGRPN